MSQPKTIDDLIGNKEIFDIIRKEIFAKDPSKCPNIYMQGINGVGKSSLMQMIADYITTDHHNLLKVKASLERGIDMVRTKIANTSSYSTIVGRRFIWFEEAYNLTPEAVEALKNIMDESPHVVFGFTSNRNTPEDITSRCLRFYFKPVGKEELVPFLQKYVRDNSMSVTEEMIDTIASRSNGDVRSCLYKLVSPPTLSPTEDILNTAIKDLKKSIGIFTSSGVNFEDFIIEATDYILDAGFDDQLLGNLLITAAKYLSMHVEGVPARIATYGFLSSLNRQINERP